jgi:DNA helicase-2/ATP-dependent DNA helicase PcrA
MMDEFQDVSADQYEFAKIIGKKANMMVVGDVQQSIYAFRGGLSKFMLSFIEDFNAVRMFLPLNYRCNDKIVEMANCLTHVSKDAIANKYIDSIPFRKSDVVPDILTFPNSELEKNFVLNTIKDKKFAYKDNLILARTNRQLYDIFSYLIDNDIPCKLIGSLPFYKLSEISTILSYLKFLNNTDNNQAFMAIINKPNRYIPKALIEGIEECTGYGESMYERMVSGEGIELKYMRSIMELRNFVNKFNLQTFHNVKEIIEYIVEELELNICLTERCSDAEAVNSVLENIDTLKGRCEKYPTIKDFLMAVKKEYEACGKIDDKTDAVILETIHKSKGAEAPRVFVTGFSEGLLPHANAISEEEELHIFYVAVTRARDELHIMHSNNVGIKKLSISRFAKYVEDYIVC